MLRSGRRIASSSFGTLHGRPPQLKLVAAEVGLWRCRATLPRSSHRVLSTQTTPTPPTPPPRPRRMENFQSAKDVYKARNRTLLMYSSAVVRPLLPLTDLPSSPPLVYFFTWTATDNSNPRRHLRLRASLQGLLLRHWVRRHAAGRERALRRRALGSRRGRSQDQSPFQRGPLEPAALDVYAPTEIRGSFTWRDELGVL